MLSAVENQCALCISMPYMVVHRVTKEENRLGQQEAFNNVDLYAAEKEMYLGNKCQVEDTPNPRQF